jgi:hypothetical protein
VVQVCRRRFPGSHYLPARLGEHRRLPVRQRLPEFPAHDRRGLDAGPGGELWLPVGDPPPLVDGEILAEPAGDGPRPAVPLTVPEEAVEDDTDQFVGHVCWR